MSSERLSILKQLNECGRTLWQNNIVCLGSGLPVIINTDLWFSVSCFSSVCHQFVRSLKPKESFGCGYWINISISLKFSLISCIYFLSNKSTCIYTSVMKNGCRGISDAYMMAWVMRSWDQGWLNDRTLMVTLTITTTTKWRLLFQIGSLLCSHYNSSYSVCTSNIHIHNVF